MTSTGKVTVQIVADVTPLQRALGRAAELTPALRLAASLATLKEMRKDTEDLTEQAALDEAIAIIGPLAAQVGRSRP